MQDKDAAAQSLAEAHFRIEPGILQIFKLRESPEREKLETTPIKLLEVNANTSSSGILPLYFGPARGVPYPSVIVEITPEEFNLIGQQQLSLPDGWTVGGQLFLESH